MELTNDNDEELQMLTKHIREETFPNLDGWYRMSFVSLKLGKPKQAEQIYQILFQQDNDESNAGPHMKKPFNSTKNILQIILNYQSLITTSGNILKHCILV